MSVLGAAERQVRALRDGDEESPHRIRVNRYDNVVDGGMERA